MDKKKITLVYTVAALMILGLLGYTYAYFSATVTEDNKTQTVIKANELSLTFNGTSEITADDMIPGDSFTKTFTVENTSTVKTFYNIYMEGITNEFNEDLVYTLTDEDGTVVAEAPLPVTNTGKSYLIENIEIEPSEIKEYTLTIEYKYLDTSQNDYQGAEFKATVGVDTVKVETPNTSIKVDATDSQGNNLNATASNITGEEKEKLLTSLEETGYITNKDEVDTLIEVESDDFENLATTTFDVSNIAKTGDTVVILHFDEEKQEWEYIGTEIVNAEGKVIGDFTSYSPVAFVVVKEDSTFENIIPQPKKYYAFGLPTVASTINYNDVIASSGGNVFVQLEGEQLSVCMYINNTLECFKYNNYDEEVEHLKRVFNNNCKFSGTYLDCTNNVFYCITYPNGFVGCNDISNNTNCHIDAADSAECGNIQ